MSRVWERLGIELGKTMTGELDVVRARTAMTGRNAAGAARRKGRGRGILAAVLGVIVASAGLLGSTQAAVAAPTVTYPGAVSDIVLVNENSSGPLVQTQKVRISGEWAVPAGAVAGETFGMTLPEEFSRQATGVFDITDPVTGLVMANCVVSTGQGPDMVCTLTAAVEGLEDVGGSFWLEARATQTTTNETVEFDLGDEIAIVDLPGDGGIVTEQPTEEAQPYKYGGVTAVDGRLRWVVGVPSGFVEDGGFTIRDTLDAGASKHHYTGELRLNQRAIVNGEMVGDWAPVDPARYQTVFAGDDQSFELVASGLPATGFTYELVYFTMADEPVLQGDVFGNSVVVNTTETKSTYTITESGGGTGGGITYTSFAITKALVGAQAGAAQNGTFTVRYSVKGSDAPATTMTVPVGQPVTSARAPLGSTFVIEEIDLPVIEGVTWGAWTITGAGVSAVGDGTYEVTPGSAAGVSLTLTNTADRTPVVPPTPPTTTTPPTSTSPPTVSTTPKTPGGLASTGGTGGAEFLPIALALIVGGAIAAGAAARRRTVERRG